MENAVVFRPKCRYMSGNNHLQVARGFTVYGQWAFQTWKGKKSVDFRTLSLPRTPHLFSPNSREGGEVRPIYTNITAEYSNIQKSTKLLSKSCIYVLIIVLLRSKVHLFKFRHFRSTCARSFDVRLKISELKCFSPQNNSKNIVTYLIVVNIVLVRSGLADWCCSVSTRHHGWKRRDGTTHPPVPDWAVRRGQGALELQSPLLSALACFLSAGEEGWARGPHGEGRTGEMITISTDIKLFQTLLKGCSWTAVHWSFLVYETIRDVKDIRYVSKNRFFLSNIIIGLKKMCIEN